MKPFFSIVIPTFNRVDLLRSCLLSIQKQSFVNYEVIIVDDGGIDNTHKLIESLNDDRFKYYHIVNQERAIARNFGLSKVSGQYINYFDSDDFFLNDRLQSIHNFILTNNYPKALFSNFICSGKAQIRKKYKWIKLVQNNFLACGSVIIHHDIAKQYKFNEDRDLITAEDWELWIRIMSNYEPLFLEDVTYEQSEHENRSLNNIDWGRVLKREECFRELILINSKAGIVNKDISLLIADRYTFIALAKCMLTKFSNKEIINELIFSVRSSIWIIQRKRFWAVVVKLLSR